MTWLFRSQSMNVWTCRIAFWAARGISFWRRRHSAGCSRSWRRTSRRRRRWRSSEPGTTALFGAWIETEPQVHLGPTRAPNSYTSEGMTGPSWHPTKPAFETWYLEQVGESIPLPGGKHHGPVILENAASFGVYVGMTLTVYRVHRVLLTPTYR